MPLTKAQRAHLHTAFTNAFNHAELAQLVLVCCGVELHTVVAPGALTAEVTDLIAWAGRSGRLRALVDGACERSHLHADLRDLCAVVSAWDLDARFPPGDRGQEPWLFINVPPRPNLVLGRDALLDDLVARLTCGQSAALSADGLPGVGKTTLALALAHDDRVQARFADGVLWAGLGPSANVAAIQQAWADALGADLTGLGDPLTRRARLNAALGQRRLLLVLDDAWASADAEALRGSGPHVAHVLTTRNGKLARDFVQVAEQCVRVPVLKDDDAWTLLQRLAPEACAADPRAARALADAVGGLPLAIELLAGYLGPDVTLFPDLSRAALAELQNSAARLALARQRLGGDGRAVTLDAVIALSVDDLRRSHPAAADAFLALGACAPKPASFDRAAAEAVAGADARTLGVLAARNLLDATAEGVLSVHQVLHDYAAAHLPPGAVQRHRAHYLALANADRKDWQAIEAAYDQIAHAWDAIPDDDGDALRAHRAAVSGYHSLRGFHRADISWIERTLPTTDEPSQRATLLHNLAFSFDALGEKRRALAVYEQALPLRRQVGDRGGEATTLTNIGKVYADLGEQARALEFFEQALPLFRQVGDRRGEAATLGSIGSVYAALGDHGKALEYHQQSLTLERQVGNRSGEATTLNEIGFVYSRLGETARALEYYEQALELGRQVGDRGGEATTLNEIGFVYSRLGEQARALEYFEQALPLHQQVGDRWGEKVTRFNIGMAAAALGDLDRAVRELEQAVALDEALGHPNLASDRAALEAMRARRAAARVGGKAKSWLGRLFGA